MKLSRNMLGSTTGKNQPVELIILDQALIGKGKESF